MAATIFRHVIRNYTNTVHCLKTICRTNAIKQKNVRFLYSAQFLGLDNYREQRDRIISQFGPMKEKFRARMLQYLSSEGHAMVFTEDLKNMVYLAEDNAEDMDICVRMMKRFNQQNKELRFGTFVFGPVAMRLFYHLKKADIVVNSLKDKELDGFFDQLTSFHIAMDLLFVNERYQDVIEIYDILRNKQLYGTRYPRECVVLVLASCYKLENQILENYNKEINELSSVSKRMLTQDKNTVESLACAINIIKSAREVGANVLRKGLTFASALALKQNDPKMAIELLALTPQLNYITVKNLRLMALCELDRLDDVFPVLRSIIDRDSPTQNKTEGEIIQETVDRIQAAVDRQGNEETAHISEQISRALRDNNHVRQMSLDELLCTPVLSRPPAKDRDWSSSGGFGSGGGFQPPRRPGSSRIVPAGVPPRSSPISSLRQRQGLTDVDE